MTIKILSVQRHLISECLGKQNDFLDSPGSLLYSFSQIQYGNVVNWNETIWNVHDMKDTSSSYSSICLEKSNDIFFLPSKEGWKYEDVDPICKGLKGSSYVEDSYSKQNFVASLAKSSPYSGKYY